MNRVRRERKDTETFSLKRSRSRSIKAQTLLQHVSVSQPLLADAQRDFIPKKFNSSAFIMAIRWSTCTAVADVPLVT